MKNREVAKAFLQHEEAVGSNLYSTGDKLISYNTIIAEWYNRNTVVINNTWYSSTTSRHRNYLYPIPAYIKVINFDTVDVPKGTKDLINYLEK